MKRLWDALRAAASWVLRPPDFPVCDFANKTNGDDE